MSKPKPVSRLVFAGLLSALIINLNGLSCQKLLSEQRFTNSLGMEMIGINGGSFEMGDLTGQGDWDEKPVHQVRISRPFYISETEITVEQFQAYKPDYRGSVLYEPYATGISWYEATAFCQWLSSKEGREYRLPTEAEWEYVCRAGTTTQFSSGNMLADDTSGNDWGIKNMHRPPLEWCADWYGSYESGAVTDPVGRSSGLTKVVRGGLPDNTAKDYNHPPHYYERSANRAGMAPGFSGFAIQEPENQKIQGETEIRAGLIGLEYRDAVLNRPNKKWHVNIIDSERMNWSSDNEWSAGWKGHLKAPVTGKVVFLAEADDGIILDIDHKRIIDGWENEGSRSGEIGMTEGRLYPINIAYRNKGGASYLKLFWQLPGVEKVIIPQAFFSFNSDQEAEIDELLSREMPGYSKDFPIGFRVVQAPYPENETVDAEVPLARAGIKQNISYVHQGPDLDKPYFRKRILLPVPLENRPRAVIDAAGFHPSFRGHNHCPALEVCPNGDLLMVIYTSYHEYEPGVSLIAARLRFGEDEWDMPSPFVDFPDVNDHAPLLWHDRGRIFLFWGNPRLNSAFPFQWIYSDDNMATFSQVNFPHFSNMVGPHSRQPINSAFRDASGKIFLASDGEGGTSVLWESSDNGETWLDPQSRSAGRHTTYIELKNGDILAMGGKNTNINGFMPQAISRDRGKSWQVSASVFPALASNQRPTIIRLKSGRLFFASDFQKRGGEQPLGIRERGAFVALSDDEGKSWKIKTLPGTLPHESDKPWGNTIGYSVARQAPNGLIHLITTMNHPCLHFALNEAWILEKGDTRYDEERIMNNTASKVNDIQNFQEDYADGKIRLAYSGGIGDDRRFLLQGRETWFYPDGKPMREANYETGRKTGEETYWYPNGKIAWKWIYEKSGQAKWVQWWQNGTKKSESLWINKICQGPARCWDSDGNLISDVVFVDGKISR